MFYKHTNVHFFNGFLFSHLVLVFSFYLPRWSYDHAVGLLVRPDRAEMTMEVHKWHREQQSI